RPIHKGWSRAGSRRPVDRRLSCFHLAVARPYRGDRWGQKQHAQHLSTDLSERTCELCSYLPFYTPDSIDRVVKRYFCVCFTGTGADSSMASCTKGSANQQMPSR